MAKQALVLDKFTGGLNSYSDPRDLKEDEFQILDNACVDEEGIIRVSGAFKASEHMYGIEFDLGSTSILNYQKIPIAGKGFYSFIFDIGSDFSYDSSLGLIGNSNLENLNISNIPSEFTIPIADGTDAHANVVSYWNTSNILTSTVPTPTGNPDITEYYALSSSVLGMDTKGGYFEVNMANSVKTDSGNSLYNMGYLYKTLLTLKPGYSYRVTFSVGSTKPWYFNSQNIPPRLMIFNNVNLDTYVDGDGNFKTGITASGQAFNSHHGVLQNNGGSTVLENSIFASSVGDWERVANSGGGSSFYNEALTTETLNDDFYRERRAAYNDYYGASPTVPADISGAHIESWKKRYNALVGGLITAAGTSQTYKVLKFTSQTNNADYESVSTTSSMWANASNNESGGFSWRYGARAGQGFKMVDIDIVAGQSYFFDIFSLVNLNDSSLNGWDSWKIAFYQEKTDGTLLMLEVYELREGKSFLSPSLTSGYTAAPLPFEFKTVSASGINAKLQIHITTRGSGVTAWFGGMNLRQKTLELGTVVKNNILQSHPYNLDASLLHPNLWGSGNNTSAYRDMSIVQESQFGESNNYDGDNFPSTLPENALTSVRRYDYEFTVPHDIKEDNNWKVLLHLGRWSDLENVSASSPTANPDFRYLNIIVNYFNVSQISAVETPKLPSNIQFGGYSMFNFINYTNKINPSTNIQYTTLQINRKIVNSDSEYLMSDITSNYAESIPTYDMATNYNFIRGSNSVFICDENFNDKELYKFYYNDKTHTYDIKKVNFSSIVISKWSNHSNPNVNFQSMKSKFAANTSAPTICSLHAWYGGSGHDQAAGATNDFNPLAMNRNPRWLYLRIGDTGSMHGADLAHIKYGLNMWTFQSGEDESSDRRFEYFNEKYGSIVFMDSYEVNSDAPNVPSGSSGKCFKYDMVASQYPGSSFHDLNTEHDDKYSYTSVVTGTEFSEIEDTEAHHTKVIKNAVGWEDPDNPYTKYFTYSHEDLRQFYDEATRLAAIEVKMKHSILMGSADACFMNYIPEMTIYVDLIKDSVVDRDMSDNCDYTERGKNAAPPGSDGFIKTIASVEVNRDKLSVSNYARNQISKAWTVNTAADEDWDKTGVEFQGTHGILDGNAQVFDFPKKALNENSGDLNGTYGFVQLFKQYESIIISFPFNQDYDLDGSGTMGKLDIKSSNPNNYNYVIAGSDDEVSNTLHGTGVLDTEKWISSPDSSDGISIQIRMVPKIKQGYSSYERGVGESLFTTQSTSDNSKIVRGIIREQWYPTSIYMRAYSSTHVGGFENPYSIASGEIEFGLTFDTPSNGIADGWNDEFNFRITTVDSNGIESAFNAQDGGNYANTDLTKCPSLTFAYASDINFDDYEFIKIYTKSKRNPVYNLQAIIDLGNQKIQSTSGIKKYDSQTHTATSTSLEVISYTVPREDLLIPNEVDSYESETGILQENAESSYKMKATFKTGIIANNILYAGNVCQNGIYYPDRMLKSPIGKYPMLPSTNFIDVAINDGDEITSLKFFKDKLLQFKRNKLYIINTSEEYEYLEDTYDNLGIKEESQATVTPFGICWVNAKGCYLYNGSEVEYLIKNKISYKNWKDSESSWVVIDNYNPSIVYLKNNNRLLIYPSTESYKDINAEYSLNNDYIYYKNLGYQYDFDTKSWNVLTNIAEWQSSTDSHNIKNMQKPLDSLEDAGQHRVPYSDYRLSNFQYDEYNNVCFLAAGDNDTNYCIWNDSPQNTLNNHARDFRIVTKDYDFDSPGVNKKIYKIYVTFKSTIIESDKLEKYNQNQDLYSPSNIKVSYATDGSNTWAEFDTSSSTNYGSSGLISDDCETTTTLSSNIDSYDDTQFTVSSATNIKKGYVLYLGDNFDSASQLMQLEGSFEQMLVTNVSSSTITVLRGYNNTKELSTSYTNDVDDQVNISTGDWITAELIPSSSINNIKSFKLKFEVAPDASIKTSGVPNGFMINDITIIYRQKNVK